MKQLAKSLESLDCEFRSLNKEFSEQLAAIEQKRDFLIGRIIAEETKDFNMCEHEKIGCALRWYKFNDKEIVRKGYHYQLAETLKLVIK